MSKTKMSIFLLFSFGLIILTILWPRLWQLPGLAHLRCNRDCQFIQSHYAEIESNIKEQLYPEEGQIHSVTIEPYSAKGKFYGSLGEQYHIYFDAYVNENKDYPFKGDLEFPDTYLPMLTFIAPDPYKDEKQDMGRWFLELTVSENAYWDWKRAIESAEASRLEESFSIERSSERAEVEKLIPVIERWLEHHQDNFKQKLEEELYRADPMLKDVLGRVQSVKLEPEQPDISVKQRSKYLWLAIVFEKYPSSIARMEVEIDPENEQHSFEDVSTPAVLRFDTHWLNHSFTMRTLDSALSEAFQKSKLGATDELVIQLPDDYTITIP